MGSNVKNAMEKSEKLLNSGYIRWTCFLHDKPCQEANSIPKKKNEANSIGDCGKFG